MADGILTPCNVALWLWNRDSEFTKWQHCNVIRGSAMTCHWIRPKVRRIGILHLVSISTSSPQSTCHSAPVWSAKFYPNRTTLSRKKTSCRFSRWRISAILDFRDPIMGSLKSRCTTSYRSSIETIALNCLFFWENRVFCILATNRQTNKQTNRWTAPMH